MPQMTWEEFSRKFDEVSAELGITVLPATEPPTTTTIDVIMRQRRAESPASSDETPEERDATPDNARGAS